MCRCNLTIGIIDSYLLIRVSMTELLSKMGFKVLSAGEVSEYLIQVNDCAQQPRICIVDIDEPDINTFALARSVKAMYPDTIVLAYSVYENHELRLDRLQDYGVDVFLEKSYSPDKIKMLIYIASVKVDKFLRN